MTSSSLFILVSLVLSLASVSRVLGELECPRVAVPSDSSHMLMTDNADAARNTAVCHAICINYIFEGLSVGSPNGSNGTAPTNGTEMEMEGVLQLNCNQFKQYLDCRSGCIAQSEGQACPETCSGRCQGICGSNLGCFGALVENNDCGVSCNGIYCSEGCQRFSQLSSSVMPQERMDAPVLTRTMDHEVIYDVGITMEMELRDPSLLFRIEDQSQPGEFVYQWMVDVVFESPDVTMVEYLLNLNTFIGRTVNVSYAFATENGLSEYSESATVQVQDQCVVVALTQTEVDIDESLDEREGFFTHYVLNVSWCPNNCTEQVSHYVVTRSPSRNPTDGFCGRTVTVTANATSSSVLLKSEDNTRSLVLPCTQTVQVQTVLVDGTTQEVSENILLQDVRGDVPGFPKLKIVGCPATYDRLREIYVVDFQWRVPFSPAALSHIALLTLHIDLLQKLNDGFNDFAPLQLGIFSDNVTVNPDFDDITYNYITFLSPLEEDDHFYQLGIDVRWMPPSGPGRSDNCRPVDVFAPPPLPIQVINITSSRTVRISQDSQDLQDVTVSTSVHWEKPHLQFSADIIRYEIYLGRRVLEPDEEIEMNIEMDTDDDGLQTDTFETTFHDISIEDETLKAFLQMRSRQFDDFPSDWSEAVEIEFVILDRPDEVEDLEIDITSVDVVCGDNGTILEVAGGATWSETAVSGNVTIKHYELSINNIQVTSETESADFSVPQIPLDSGDPYVDLNFQITVTVSLMGVTQASFPSPRRPLTERFKPLPYPENIAVTAKNPRLKQLKSSNMLNMSVELTLEWDQPQSEEITSYEIYTTSSFLCAYDNFGERVGTVVNGSLTKFSQTFSDLVADQDTPMLVLMRSLVDDDIHLLPQWSEPISLTPSTLPPPEINSSSVLSISVTSPSNSDSLSVSTTVEVSWEEPEETGDLEMYEVWVGARALGEFEQPEESEVFGSILQFQVNSTTNSTTEDSNSTTAATTGPIAETFSTTFSSESAEDVTVHIQMRSVGPDGIPKWSTPSVTHRFLRVPPPTNIEVAVSNDPVLDTENKVVEVIALVTWEPPVLDDGNNEVTMATEEPTVPEVSSVIVSTTLLVAPTSTPVPPVQNDGGNPGNEVERRRRQQSNDSQTGSGMGQGESGDGVEVVPVELGELTNISIYMGRTPLDRFAPRPEENVQEFKADEVSGAEGYQIKMEYSVDDIDKPLELFVQMQIEAELGFPEWSDPMNISVTVLSSTDRPTSPPTRGPAQPQSDTNNNLAIILGVVIPIVLILLIAIVTVTIIIFYNRQKYKIMKDDDTIDLYARPGGLTGLYSSKGPVLDEWEISTDDVIVEQLLGEGAFGEVYKGVIRGPLENPKISAVLRQAIGVPVAIKLLKYSSAGKEKADFLAEIDMMKKIAEGYNTHIVNMVGCVTLQEPLCLITEFVPYGDLLSYLKYQRKKCSEARRREKLQQQQQEAPTTEEGYVMDETPQPAPYLEPANAYSHLEPKEEQEVEDNTGYNDLGDIEPDDLIRFAYQIASGMEYLASLKIVHRDLACRNVLIAKDKLLKITDFGLSREVQEVYVKKTRGRLPLKWMAIESITAREFTTASDVWAFGVTLYEIGTIGGFPYPSINNEDLLRMLTQGYRLEKPDNCSAEVYDLMLQCWQEEPMDRPSFSQLRSSFSAMLQAGSADEYIDLQVNEEAPYYQIKDDDQRERSDSTSSDGSVSSIDKQKKPKEKVKRKVTNPYVPTPEQGQQQGQGDDEGYIAMTSAGAAQERPVQLGIPISQLVPASSSTQNAGRQLTPVDEATPQDHTPLERRTTNPYVQEPSEAIEGSLVAASVPVTVARNGVHSESMRQSSLDASELVESTHL